MTQDIVRSGPRAIQELGLNHPSVCLDATETPHGLTRDTHVSVRARSVAWGMGAE